jgi:serine phosphatase RsbU (regulator of sigma subunit)
MIKAITQRLPLRVALPLLLASIVLACVIALVLLFQSRADGAVLNLARQNLDQLHDRIRDRIDGAGGADATLLEPFLRSIGAGRAGAIYVMDDHGLLVATSTGVAILEPGSGSRHTAQASGNPLIAASASRLAGKFMGAGFPHRISDDFELDNERVLVTAARFDVPGQPRWLLVTAMPAHAYLAQLHAGHLEGMLMAGGVVLVAVLLGTLLALYVARPITELTAHMRRIGQGRLDEEIMLTEFPEFMRLSFATNNMVEGLRENLKLRNSLSMAMEVQQRLLPAEVPRYPGLEMAGRSYYCDETGGDYYDFLKINSFPDTSAVIAIGDVSGHGIASAMVMAAARVILRSRCRDAVSFSELLGHMNAQIVEDSEGGRYMTMLLVAADAANRELRWASAGHREPLLLDPGATELQQLQGADIPLGISADAQYQEHVHQGLRPGQVILLATDGLWEAANNAGEPYGLARLGAVMRDHGRQGAQGICAAIALNVLEFCGNMAQRDDISFVVVKVTA